MRVTQVIMLGRHYPKFSCLGGINQVHPPQSLDVPCKRRDAQVHDTWLMVSKRYIQGYKRIVNLIHRVRQPYQPLPCSRQVMLLNFHYCHECLTLGNVSGEQACLEMKKGWS